MYHFIQIHYVQSCESSNGSCPLSKGRTERTKNKIVARTVLTWPRQKCSYTEYISESLLLLPLHTAIILWNMELLSDVFVYILLYINMKTNSSKIWK